MAGYDAYNPKQLKDVILRRLGAPITNVEVTEDQIYDCIQRALELYGEYHFDGLNKSYQVFYIGEDELWRDGMFQVDTSVFAVTQIIRTNVGSITSMDGQATYPWFTDFLLGMAGINGGMGSSCSKSYGPNAFGADLGYFTQLMQYRSMMQDMLSPLPDYWYNSDTGQLRIMGNFEKNDIVICEVYVKSYIDVSENLGATAGYITAGECGAKGPSMLDVYNRPSAALTSYTAGSESMVNQGSYNNRWVKDYATTLVKELNGQILAKHQGMQLAGGITVDGVRLIEEAREEKRLLREELDLLDAPVGILVG
ncbi:neck protein [Providencia phage PSTRCR_121]|nr:neck protein [Providencia phage PSTRCR_121]UGO50194.1 putative neck protein [Morganella phage vB_MmoM_Rgz1]